MSHYVDITTEITDSIYLVKALERMEFRGKVETFEHATGLYGYKGDLRPQKAHVILRRVHVGSASNDIGFEKDPVTGKFIARISEYDQGKYNQEWLNKVYTYYGIERAKGSAQKNGYSYREEVDEKNRVKLRIMI